MLLCALLLRTGWLALRRRERSEVTAAMADTLLIIDAWFDVPSAPDTAQFLIALAMAVFVELPLAGMCLWLCRRVGVERSRREAALAAALRRAFAAGRVPVPGPSQAGRREPLRRASGCVATADPSSIAIDVGAALDIRTLVVVGARRSTAGERDVRR